MYVEGWVVVEVVVIARQVLKIIPADEGIVYRFQEEWIYDGCDTEDTPSFIRDTEAVIHIVVVAIVKANVYRNGTPVVKRDVVGTVDITQLMVIKLEVGDKLVTLLLPFIRERVKRMSVEAVREVVIQAFLITSAFKTACRI